MLVESDPLWIIHLAFLSYVHHRWKEHSVLSGNRILNVEESPVMLADVSLSPLKSLVRKSGFLLQHLVQFLLWRGKTFGLRS